MELLVCYREQIVENVIRRMFSYAIGRKMTPHDRVAIEKIKSELERNDYRMSVLIEQIITSKQFLQRLDRN